MFPFADKCTKLLSDIFELGYAHTLSLRYCSIRSYGSLNFGKAVCNLSDKLLNNDGKNKQQNYYSIDLSGNELGIMKNSSSKKNTKSKLSSEKVALSYFKKFGKQLKSSFNDLTAFNEASAESDDDFENDDEEHMNYLSSSSSSKNNVDSSRIKNMHSITSLESELDAKQSTLLSSGVNKCGVRSFVEPFITNDDDDDEKKRSSSKSDFSNTVLLGLRYCHLDQGGIEALAAAIIQAKKKYNINLKVDISLNHALEEQLLDAYDDDDDDNNGASIIPQAFSIGGSCIGNNDDGEEEESSSLRRLLQNMADKYWKKINLIRLARQRAQIMEDSSNLFSDVPSDDSKPRRRRRRSTTAFFEEEEEDYDYDEGSSDYQENDDDTFGVDEEEEYSDYEEIVDTFVDEELSDQYEDNDYFDDFS